MGSGLTAPSQSAAVADILGSHARGGPILATFQMVSDVGAVIGPIVAGALAQHVSYSSGFAVTGAVLLAATVCWLFSPEPLARGDASARKAEPDQ